ncbi:hypothetical protein DXV24_12080 [Escherichia albertii]|nr:hypothetical protein [Escherichia albertii]
MSWQYSCINKKEKSLPTTITKCTLCLGKNGMKCHQNGMKCLSSGMNDVTNIHQHYYLVSWYPLSSQPLLILRLNYNQIIKIWR